MTLDAPWTYRKAFCGRTGPYFAFGIKPYLWVCINPLRWRLYRFDGAVLRVV